MKKFWGVLIIFGVLLAGCSEKDEKPKLTVKDAIKKDHVVVENYSEKMEDLMTGATKTGNLERMFSFLKDVEENKESTLTITIFPKNGPPVTNELHYINKEKTVFTNNYKGYEMPTGNIECMYAFETNHSLQVDGCKGNPSTLLVIPYSAKEYRLAKNEFRKQSASK